MRATLQLLAISRLKRSQVCFKRRTSFILRTGNLLLAIQPPPTSDSMALDCPALPSPLDGRFGPRRWPTYSDRVAELLRDAGRFAPKYASRGPFLKTRPLLQAPALAQIW